MSDVDKSECAYADGRLLAWGSWSRRNLEHLGYPRVSLIYKVLRRRAKRGALFRLLLQLTAQGHETRSLRPRTVGEMPDPIAEIDRLVARLKAGEQELLRAEYMWYGHLPIEARAAFAHRSAAMYRRDLRDVQRSVARALALVSPPQIVLQYG